MPRFYTGVSNSSGAELLPDAKPLSLFSPFFTLVDFCGLMRYPSVTAFAESMMLPPRRESTDILPAVREEFEFAYHIVRCAIYICWWRAKRYIWFDKTLAKRAKAAAAISGVVLFFDIFIFFVHELLAFLLGGFALVVLIPSALLLAWHRIEEYLTKEKEASFAEKVVPVVDALRTLALADPDKKEAALEQFVRALLKKVYEDFSSRKPTNVNVMFPGNDDKLRIVYLYPPATEYDPAICFEPGEGGSGFCFHEAVVVYIPNIRYEHGIIVEMSEPERTQESKIKYGLKRRLYVPTEPQYEIYSSIICVPVTSPLGKHAVLNLDSELPDAFDSQDFYVLKAYARALGDGISLCAR